MPITPKGATPTPTPRNPLLGAKSKAQQEAERQAKAYVGKASREYYDVPVDAQLTADAQVDAKRLQQQEAARQSAAYTGKGFNEYAGKITGALTQPIYDALSSGGNLNPNQPPAAPTPSGGSGGAPRYGSSGGGGAVAAPQPTLQDQLAAIQQLTGTIDPSLGRLVPNQGQIEMMYKRLTDSFGANKASLDKDYQAAIDAVRANYGQGNELVQNAITGDMNSLAQAAANLGVNTADWNTGPTAQAGVEQLNRLLGQSGQNQATDLAWFEKLRTLDSSQFQNFMNQAGFQKQGALEDSNQRMQQLQELANEQARQQALEQLMAETAMMAGGSGGGSGGGGRRGGFGGGGGSSSKGAYQTLSQSATQSGDLDFVGFANQLSTLPPELQNLVTGYWVLGGSSGEGAAKAVLNDILRGTSPLGGDQNALNYAYQMFLDYTPGLKPIYSQATQDKTAQSTKQYGVPPITNLSPAPTGSKNTGLKGVGQKAKAAVGAKTPPKTPQSKAQTASKSLKKLF